MQHLSFKRALRRIRIRQLRLQKMLTKLGLPDYTLFTAISILIGAAAGLAAVFFHDTIDFFSEIFLGDVTGTLAFLGVAAIIAIPAIGMLLQSLMTYAAPDTACERGVIEVIKAVALRGGYISSRTTLFHFLAPAICIGTGGTVGPEGPAAQLGGGVASRIGRLFGFSESRRRMFTAAGAGAAISAVFNTPLGGVFFALEIILLNDFQTATFSALILASVSASAISRIFLGNQPAFIFEKVIIGPYNLFYLYAILGIGAGILSLLQIQYSERLSHFFKRPRIQRIPRWLKMVVVGLALGVTGYFYRDIFGIGYAAINHILANGMAWQTIAVLLALKFIFVPLILESGGFGGMFAPSLFIGACYGYLFAFGANHLFGLHLHTTTFALVGMGAMLGGINSIPISAILIIFEMSREYTFILPLMLGVITSTTLVHLVIKDSIHGAHLKRAGYRISHGRETSILRSIKAREVMHRDAVIIPQDMPLPQFLKECIESPHNSFYTVDQNGCLTGIITMAELRPIITEYEHIRKMLIAGDIANSKIIKVREDDDLDYVMNLLAYENVDELPVVSAKNESKVVGNIWRQDVIKAYNRASLRYNISDELAKSLKTVQKTRPVTVAEGYAVIEIETPRKFIGKSIAQLRLRNRYGLDVLMIRPGGSTFSAETPETTIPSAEYTFQPGDVLVLFGKTEDIERVQKMG